MVREVRRQHPRGKAPGFQGAIVGAIAYDAIAHFDAPTHERKAPHFLLGLYLDAVVYDHRQGQVRYVTTGEDRSQEVLAAAEAPAQPPGPFRLGRVATNTDARHWGESVRAVKKHIRDGETYQTVLSRRFDASFKGDLAAAYRRLRERTPSPYMYDLDLDGHRILGSSPEMLCRVEGHRVETFPIAGTRPLAATKRHNEARKRELLADPKENAEHLMLVDLARNDIGRVAKTGSVRVPEFRQIGTYASVHHMVSRVQGRLKADADACDAFRAIFPAGTVSGAPKVRSMQIIDALERQPRGFYAGAIASFGLNGDLDSAITIRTLVARDGKLSVQAGAGIVQDSTAPKEYAETRHKAETVLGALREASA